MDAWSRLVRALETAGYALDPPARGEAHLRRLRMADAQGHAYLDRDDLEGALVLVRRDLPHLDADALNDRLHAWTKREVERVLPHASAFVSFRHARPATLDEAELGLQEEWLGLEPTFRLEMARPPATERDVEAFVRLVPEFLRRVESEGRPEGWRQVDVGNAE